MTAAGKVVLVAATPLPRPATARLAVLGLPVQPIGTALPKDARALLVGEADQVDLANALTAPYQGFLELGLDNLAGVGAACYDAVRGGGLALSLSTHTVYGADLVTPLAAAVRGRLAKAGLNAAGVMIELCLNEAISNAVIHGNLAVGSEMRGSRDGVTRFGAALSARLADPDLAGRRIEITFRRDGPTGFCLTVGNQGEGFDVESHLARKVEPRAKHGRGIPLIAKIARSVTSADSGRSLVMGFEVGQ